MANQGGRIAIYAGSFDPITLGHADIIRRACHLFDEVIVAVGEARGKAPLFSAAERTALITAACQGIGNVRAESFRGLVADFAIQRRAVALVRGVRSVEDYGYEVQMANMNRALRSNLETVFIPTSAEYSHISSSLAKEIATHGGDVSLLVPAVVAGQLKAKIASLAK